MKYLLWGLTVFFSTYVHAGVDGPCPVPNAPLPLAAHQTCFATTTPVKAITLLDHGRLVLQSDKDEALVLIYDTKTSMLPLPEGIVSFSSARHLYHSQTLRPLLVPTWFQNEKVLAESREAVLTGQPFFRKGRTYFRVSQMAADDYYPRPVCLTPAAYHLRASEGSAYPYVYFHSIEKGRLLRQFVLDVRYCQWTEISRQTLYYASSPEAQVTVFSRHHQSVVKQSPEFSWTKQLVKLDDARGLFLYQDRANHLGIYSLSRGDLGLVYLDAPHFSPELVTFDTRSGLLFIANAVEESGKLGVRRIPLSFPH